MSSPSCICHPSVRTQPNVPLVHGLPVVPTKNRSSPPGSKSARLAVGSWKGWATSAGAAARQQVSRKCKRITALTTGGSLAALADEFSDAIEAANETLSLFASEIWSEDQLPVGQALADDGRCNPSRFPELRPDRHAPAVIGAGVLFEQDGAIAVELDDD